MKKTSNLFISTSIVLNSVIAIASAKEQPIENSVCVRSNKLSEILDDAIKRDKGILDFIKSKSQSTCFDLGTDVCDLPLNLNVSCHENCHENCHSNCHSNCHDNCHSNCKNPCHSNCNCATGVRG
jgi:hypothetical protein